MYFHIDEAGNTGNNLFDSAQPRLSYGVLSSLRNVDALCTDIHKEIQREIGDGQIHANQLGFGGLVRIAPLLIEIQRKMEFDFDYYCTANAKNMGYLKLSNRLLSQTGDETCPRNTLSA
ncbi:hypothetical protein [Methylobacter sp. sgz302048]|uniref:hypothetical protein n=1 Tax=Methylobacter sp. sgz302048 TaxID=3455945 RepID=UPI003F9FBEE0